MMLKAKVAAVVVASLVLGVPLALKMSKGKSAAAQPSHVVPDPSLCGASTVGACSPESKGKDAAHGGVPRFVDLGTTSCAPCKVMLAVMADLERRYPGAVQIEFVNVKDDPDKLDQFGVKVIPTQIFFSPEGKELFRHTGVYPVEAIVAKWKELGYDLAPRKEGT